MLQCISQNDGLEISDELLARKDLTALHKMVLASIHRLHARNDLNGLHTRNIAGMIGVSERSVQRAIRDLDRLGEPWKYLA